MSAPACLFFYGLRFDVSPDEIPSLEDRTHPLVLKAKDAGLQHYWAEFDGPGKLRYLFVGRKLAVLGVEDALAARFTEEELRAEGESVRAKLKAAGLDGEPTLWLRWIPDA